MNFIKNKKSEIIHNDANHQNKHTSKLHVINDILHALKGVVSLRRMTYQNLIHSRGKVRDFLEFCYKHNLLFPLLVFIISLLIYINNLLPGVYGGDSGDFLTAIVTKGVPHPSGYPLYTTLGIVFNSILPGSNPAIKVGVLSSIFASLGVVIAYAILNELSKNKFLSFFGSLTLAFTYTYWLYAEVVEVFSMHIFFILLIIFITLRYIRLKENKYLLLLSFAMGLSLTNNHSILLIFPPVAFVIFLTNIKIMKLPRAYGSTLLTILSLSKDARGIFSPRFACLPARQVGSEIPPKRKNLRIHPRAYTLGFLRRGIKNIKIIFLSIFLFISALTPYMYIPIASSNNPSVNWGRGVTLDNLLKIFTRFDYMNNRLPIPNTSEHIFSINMVPYFIYLNSYIKPVFILLFILGLLYLLKNKLKKQLLFFLLLFLLLGPFYVFMSGAMVKNYGIMGVLERFYLSSIVICIIVAPLGIAYLLDLITKIIKSSSLTKLLSICFIISPLILNLFLNYKKLNLKNVTIGNDFAYDILFNIPNKSVLFLNDDSISFNTIYLNKALKYRPDVTIAGHYNDEGNRLILSQAGLLNSESEKDLIINRNKIDSNVYFSNIVTLLNNGYPVFTDIPIEIVDEVYGKTISIPYGILFRIELASNYQLSQSDYKMLVENNYSNYHIAQLYSNSFILSENIIFQSIAQLYVRGYLSVSEFFFKYYDDLDSSRYYYNEASKLSNEII